MSFDGFNCSALAQKFGTPTYVYSARAIRANYHNMVQCLSQHITSATEIHYAYKGNSSPAICKLLHNEGAGAEVVSLGELHEALLLGVPPRRIIFNNVVKTDEELEYAIQAGIGMIVIDSDTELDAIQRIAASAGRKVSAGIRIRPNVRAGFHEHVSTGHEETKFGFSPEAADRMAKRAAAAPNIQLRGLHSHIGSQACDPQQFLEAADVVFDLARRFRADYKLPIEVVDLGGGMGIQAEDHARVTFAFAELAKGLEERLGKQFAADARPTLYFEPNRVLVGDAAILLGRVISIKKDVGRTFVGCDIGYSSFIRPMLYGAYHDIRNVRYPWPANPVLCELVGSLCESGDVLGKDRPLPAPAVGDVLALMDAGAYGYAQSSQYNSRPRPLEVLIDRGETFVIRERESLADVLGRFEIPAHILATSEPR
jgi:diaminopimelate decarboxylase